MKIEQVKKIWKNWLRPKKKIYIFFHNYYKSHVLIEKIYMLIDYKTFEKWCRVLSQKK